MISYYLNNREELDEYLAERNKQYEQIREANDAGFGHYGLREKLLARRQETNWTQLIFAPSNIKMKFLADEDFNNDILRGLFRIFPNLDVEWVQDVGLMAKHDMEILEWASKEDRIILTHDYSTMINFAYERVEKGEKLSGVVVLRQLFPIGQAIEELSIFIECSLEGEWEDQVVFIPLQE